MGRVTDLLGTPQFLGTAAEHVVTNVPVFRPDDTVGTVRRAMAGQQYESVADVAVCEDSGGVRRLIGLVSAERLIAAHSDARLSELADRDPPIVAPGVDQEVAAWCAFVPFPSASGCGNWSGERH
jgi:magnesium transporter